jgi:hypothetical protein
MTHLPTVLQILLILGFVGLLIVGAIIAAWFVLLTLVAKAMNKR